MKTLKVRLTLTEEALGMMPTSKEVHDMNGELIGDNRNLFRVINKMKKYLTVAELYEVNKEIADTGYKFLEMEDGEFEMFVTRERNEVSGE